MDTSRGSRPSCEDRQCLQGWGKRRSPSAVQTPLWVTASWAAGVMKDREVASEAAWPPGGVGTGQRMPASPGDRGVRLEITPFLLAQPCTGGAPRPGRCPGQRGGPVLRGGSGAGRQAAVVEDQASGRRREPSEGATERGGPLGRGAGNDHAPVVGTRTPSLAGGGWPHAARARGTSSVHSPQPGLCRRRRFMLFGDSHVAGACAWPHSRF